MSRVIVECPACGAWDGPADGDAGEFTVAYCEECLAHQCARCETIAEDIYEGADGRTLCRGCYASQADLRPRYEGAA